MENQKDILPQVMWLNNSLVEENMFVSTQHDVLFPWTQKMEMLVYLWMFLKYSNF